MAALLLAVIYLAFISLGLPDSLLGSAWPTMRAAFGVPSSWAGYVAMTISCMTIVSALLSPRLIRRFSTKWIVVGSTGLTVLGLLGFSAAGRFWLLFLFAVPYGLGAGAIDAALNHYVANHYSAAAMNFLHCFYGVGAVISPNIMALALRTARWNEGYRWTAWLQLAILAVCLLSLPLWKRSEEDEPEESGPAPGIRETLRVPGVLLTLFGFFCYCAGEQTGFLWTPSYFVGPRYGLRPEEVASFGSLVFGGLMLGRLLAGIFSRRLGDRTLIRIGIAVELLGIALAAAPFAPVWPAALGFVLAGTGMGPVYPSIQHMAPVHFGRRYSAPVIGLQMASAYAGSTLMPMVFGLLQQALGIGLLPLYLALFAGGNILLLELAYRAIRRGSPAAPGR